MDVIEKKCGEKPCSKLLLIAVIGPLYVGPTCGYVIKINLIYSFCAFFLFSLFIYF